jgi:hypothetical protein
MERPLLRLCREILFRETDLLLRVGIRHTMNRVYKKGIDDPDIPRRLRKHAEMIRSPKLKAKLLRWLEAIDDDVEEEEENDDDDAKFQVRSIIGLRLEDTSGGRMYLVRWKGYGADDDSWEPAHQLIEDGCGDLIAKFHKEHMKFF